MGLIQKVSVESSQIAFGSLASSLMAMVLLEGLDSSRINFVSYKENSIKNTERSMPLHGSSENNRPTAD